jgi:hypothetical protein
MIYDRIEGLCLEKKDRVKWIIDLVEELGITYRVDRWYDRGKERRNIVLPGEGDAVRALMAHHDIVNQKSDNANDNSASVINAIALKLIKPETLVVLTDGEEVGGLGAARFGEQCLDGAWGQVEWVLNLELTGIGGTSFFIGKDGSSAGLGRRIDSIFSPERHRVPFNDSVVLRRLGIDSVVINPLPRKEDGVFDWSILARCHTELDSLDSISTEDMRAFTEGVLEPIISS